MKLLDDLTALFESGRAAHRAEFHGPMEDDPDWPIWFADYLLEPLHRLADPNITRSRLVHCLITAEDERLALAEDEDWAEFHARHFVECFARPQSPEADRLSLYYFPSCPFCRRVLKVIDELDIDVELRDVQRDPIHREALIGARSRATVPVLRIQGEDKSDRWMPESTDIIRYLREVYG